MVETLAALILLLPLAGAAAMLLAGRRMPRLLVQLICCTTVGLAFAATVVLLLQPAPGGETGREIIYGTWMPGLGADFAVLIDSSSALLMLVITGIGFLIHLYSCGYMEHEAGVARFFGYLNLFVFFMLLLVMSNNLALTFAGWEGVGLSSYLLIGFYVDRPAAGNAANKAFLTNRVADAAYLLAMFTILAQTGTLRYREFLPQLAPEWAATAAVLLLLAAMGKSAQYPFAIWLPDAMEGPTPVSALIHAATMVTAGVFLIVRCAPVFNAAPQVLAVISVVGAVTALLAATIALVQNDIKRVLAYSTVSQLGLMFIALGVGAYDAALFHLFTHAFFKALLFLCAGAVIHSLDGEQDMRRMGGLKKQFPFAFWTMVIGTLAIAGVPGLAGFVSKDQILWLAFKTSPSLWAFGIATSLLTAFYMWRLITMTFLGESHHAEPHSLPLTMRAPLAVLALGSVVAGWLPLGLHNSDHQSMEYVLMGVAIGAAASGIAMAHFRWRFLSPLYFLFERGWYVDQAAQAIFIRGAAQGGGELLGRLDRSIIDGAVNGFALLTRSVGRLSRMFDAGVVDGLVRLTGFLVKAVSYPVRLLQTGSLQSYALIFLAGLAAVLAWALAGGASR
ncbi:MAG: NADH-quinone oxidoreductase subunit L [Acidobacteria bacterium]|nr:NADH-quinone oxidoreductase subunit L [Acidobacteriota bacterium]